MISQLVVTQLQFALLGEIAAIDPRSDPLSLSALLCESRDGRLHVSMWLLRTATAQCAVHAFLNPLAPEFSLKF